MTKHTAEKKEVEDEREKVAGETKMPRPILGDIFMLQELLPVLQKPREERMINTTKQGRFYVAAFTTNRHVTRRRFAGVDSLSLGALSKCLAGIV